MKAKFLFEKFTDQNSDPIHDLGIGSKYLVEKWIEENKNMFGIASEFYLGSNYKINGSYLDISRSIFSELPKYIKLGKIDYLACYFNEKKLLKQLPKEISKKLKIYCNKFPDFNIKDIKKNCKIKKENIKILVLSARNSGFEEVNIE